MKEVRYEVDFLYEEEQEGFLQINTVVLLGMAKHCHSSWNNKFIMPLQYLKQEVRYKVDSLHADKHQNWFQHFGLQSFPTG